tara:strand:+ start:605 stop:865 length:261 start_codon:yes stop_codon:yes gene_type:complete
VKPVQLYTNEIWITKVTGTNCTPFNIHTQRKPFNYFILLNIISISELINQLTKWSKYVTMSNAENGTESFVSSEEFCIGSLKETQR